MEEMEENFTICSQNTLRVSSSPFTSLICCFSFGSILHFSIPCFHHFQNAIPQIRPSVTFLNVTCFCSNFCVAPFFYLKKKKHSNKILNLPYMLLLKFPSHTEHNFSSIMRLFGRPKYVYKFISNLDLQHVLLFQTTIL